MQNKNAVPLCVLCGKKEFTRRARSSMLFSSASISDPDDVKDCKFLIYQMFRSEIPDH